MKLWQRYLFRQIGATFLFLILCLFIVYVLLDLSINGVRFLGKGQAELLALFLYYLRSFSVHLELFLPLSFLLTALKVLLDLNTHLELVALQMAGLSRKKLLLPFFVFAAFLSLLCYANSEWLSPTATGAMQAFKASPHNKKLRREHLHALILNDGSELVYQQFDPTTSELFDVFWLRSPKDIWHIQSLSIEHLPPTGRHVDHLVRNQQLENVESFENRIFSELPITADISPKAFVPFESRPLSTLFREALYASSDKAAVQTHLHSKLALPLLSFFVLLAIAPIATQFARTRSRFLIVSLSLFAFIALMTLFDSLLILGENRVLSPWLATWLPMSFLFTLSFYRFAKL